MTWGAAPKPRQQDGGLAYPLMFAAGIVLIYLVSKQSTPSPPRTTNQTRGSSSLNSRSYAPPSPSASSSSQPQSQPQPQTETPTPPTGPSHPFTPFTASKSYKDGKYHLLLCATGSVATIKIPSICSALQHYTNLSIRIMLSDSACKFLQGQSEEQPHWGTLKQRFKNVHGVYVDKYEWTKPWVRGDSILHIELRRWADLMVIAPLSANALAKLAQGMSDSLIMSVARAWDTDGLIDGLRPGVVLEDGSRKKTIMVAPAMNTAMWRHPATQKHLNVLVDEWGVQNGGWIELLAPIEKGLACGDAGSGGMKEWKTVVEDIERKFPRLRKEAVGASGLSEV